MFLAAAVLSSLTPGNSFSAGEQVRVLRNLPYAETGPTGDDGSRQSLDLHVPTHVVTKPPLVVFVHGGFWMLSDDKYGIGKSLADVLVKKGVAVALWRNPIFSTEPFWKNTPLIRAYPIDARFVHRLSTLYGPMKFELLEWP